MGLAGSWSIVIDWVERRFPRTERWMPTLGRAERISGAGMVGGDHGPVGALWK